MDPTTLAVLGIIVMLALVFLRVPIGFALMGTGVVGSTIMIGPSSALQLLASDVYRQFSSYTMAVIPLFILMGMVIFHSGISSRLFAAAYRWVGHLPGGIAATTILSSIGFAAVSGSNSAATATMGSVALPEMKRYDYHRAMAGGAVAIGGTLGVLIPPSTALIIIAVQSQQSISTLFQAALFPGVLVGVLLLLTTLLMCWRRPELGPPGERATWGQRFRSLNGVIEVVVLFVLAIGGMFAGWFTPTEAAGVGALGAFVLAFLGRRLDWAKCTAAVSQTLRLSAMVVILIAGAVVFGRFMALSRLPFDLAQWVGSLPVAPVVVLLVITIPIFFPLITSLGYDEVWFTIIVTLVTTLGAVTPPVGVNVFIVSGLDKSLDVVTVFRGVVPYFVPYAAALALFITVPSTILFAVR